MRIEMKKALIAISVLTTLIAPVMLPAQEKNGYGGFSVSEEPILPAKEVHPSLWFRADGIEALRAKRNADTHAAGLWRKLAASPYVSMPIPALPAQDANKEAVHKYYGAMPQIAAVCALMSILADDEADRGRFAQRAKQALLRSYDGPLYEIDPKKQSTAADEIYRGTWAQHYCAAYDFLHGSLTPEEDKAIRASFVKEATYMHENLMGWADRPHNHLSKPAWGLGTFAITLSDLPEAKDWLRRALTATNMNTRDYFSADGLYREGSMYYLFSLINFVPFLYHYRNAAGVDQFPEWQPAFEWPILTRNGRGWMPNIEDSYIRPFPSEMVAGAYRGAKTRLSADGDLAGVLQWNHRNTDYAPFDESERVEGFNYTGASWDYNREFHEFLCYDPTIRPAPPTGSSTMFMESGQTVFRNDWSFNDPAHRYLLFHGVAEAENHQHYEHLSFIVQAQNQMMASDSGYVRKSYGEAIRKTWYLTSEAHNVVTVDGSAPIDPKKNVTPISRQRLDTEWFDFEEKEAPYEKGGRLRRAIAFAGQDHWIVLDRVELPEEREIAVLLHGGRGSHAADGPRHTWTYGKDTYGPAAAMDAFVLVPGAANEIRNGEITYIKGDYKEFPYLRAALRGNAAGAMQIVVPRAVDAPVPLFEDLTDGEFYGGRLIWADGTTEEHAARNQSGVYSGGNLRSDATYSGARFSKDGLAWFAMREGTFLEIGGAPIVRSESPITLLAGRILEGNRMEIVLSEDDGATLTIGAPNAMPVKRALLRGNELAMKPDDRGLLTLSVSAGSRITLEF